MATSKVERLDFNSNGCTTGHLKSPTESRSCLMFKLHSLSMYSLGVKTNLMAHNHHKQFSKRLHFSSISGTQPRRLLIWFHFGSCPQSRYHSWKRVPAYFSSITLLNWGTVYCDDHNGLIFLLPTSAGTVVWGRSKIQSLQYQLSQMSRRISWSIVLNVVA